MIKKIERYVASDGREFGTENEAVIYERQAKVEVAAKSLGEALNYSKAHLTVFVTAIKEWEKRFGGVNIDDLEFFGIDSESMSACETMSEPVASSVYQVPE